MTPGWLVKATAIYREPFWRADGLSRRGAQRAGAGDDGLRQHPARRLTRRAGRLRRRPRRPRIREARQVRAPAGRARLLRIAVRAASAQAERYIERDWAAEPWSGGGPVSNFATGGWTASGPALRAPVGPIHWAGTETATRWAGYIDGAVSSGERAAAEVLAAL